ncbi:MAG TPA: CTP synthase [Anaerolineae bacterium]|nr:CTP synthase [Anaerolineae bacterium]
MPKHIFVTGGVVSSLGKGLTSASIGMLLENMGLRVGVQKFDPYINVDPGTMSPFQHGEVYVTDDGAETDLDLGHYERFMTRRTSRNSNFTAGQVYDTVIRKERRGEFLGRTIQVIPHITDQIKSCILALANEDLDVVITELGGTVGDIEGLPFLEAIRQFGLDVGRRNVIYIHLTLIPFLRASQEIKTKPTQHSVAKLRELGLMPDILICRTEKPLKPEVREKLSLFCNVEKRAVIEEIDLQETSTIYELPLVLMREGLDKLIAEKLDLPKREPVVDRWREMLGVLRNPKREVEVAVVGKYMDLQSAYESIYEALTHGGVANGARVIKRRVESEEIESKGAEACLGGVDGILVPGGFGIRGTEGKINAVRYAREKKIPYFGICLGMQMAVVEFARNVCGLDKANSTEFDADTPHPVVCLLEELTGVRDMGGTMRLGAKPCVLSPDSLTYAAYGQPEIKERHRHRYEFNNAYRERFEKAGMRFAGLSPDKELVEIVELRDHPWFVAVQFHPEFRSRPIDAHPLFADFIEASLKRKMARTQ